MSTESISRKPEGTPTGGQFTASPKAEPVAVDLASVPVSLERRLAAMDGTGTLELTIEGIDFTIYYDERESRGDNGTPVRGSITGDFEVAEGPLVGGKGVVLRQHVSPTGQGSDSKGYAVGRVAGYLTERGPIAKRNQTTSTSPETELDRGTRAQRRPDDREPRRRDAGAARPRRRLQRGRTRGVSDPHPSRPLN